MPRLITLQYSDELPAWSFWRDVEKIALADRRSLGYRFGEPCNPAVLAALYDVEEMLLTYEDYDQFFGRSMAGQFSDLGRWSGAMLALPEDSYLIMINPDHLPARQRLSLAHEFGHLAYNHNPVCIDYAGNMPYTRYSDAQERQAYAYALAVLLPYAPILQMLRQGATVSGIARHYGVSPAAVQMRCKATGLWGLTQL